MNGIKIFTIALVVFTVLMGQSRAEDIELYVGSIDQRTGQKPQVLIIFDNSGSMNGEMTLKSSYDPATTYPGLRFGQLPQ